jgi:hypothetical protein
MRGGATAAKPSFALQGDPETRKVVAHEAEVIAVRPELAFRHALDGVDGAKLDAGFARDGLRETIAEHGLNQDMPEA